MSGLINRPVLLAHPSAPAAGRTLEYIYDDGAGTVEPYYMKSDGIPLPISAGGGGVTDHLLLSNIGVKTHATLDTEVGLNNAKVGITPTQASDITTNNAKVTNVTTDLAYTTAATTGTVTSSDGTDATLPAATTSLAGLQTGADKTKLDAITGTNTGDEVSATVTIEGIVELATLAEVDIGTDTTRAVTAASLATIQADVDTNTAKVTNVTTDLATTHNASTVVVTSSDGTDATINAATATTAGIMSEAIYDDHVLNNAKVSDINHVTIELPNVDNTSDADKPVSTAQAIANTTDRNRANHTGTQVASTISDFDTEVSNNTSVTVNSSKVTNATHTGEVTGSGVLTVDKTSITNKTTVTAVSGDFLLISDTGDTGNLKKVDVSDFINVGDALPAAIAGVITLADNTTYTLIGATNIGTDRIVFGVNSSIRGHNPQQDIITYTGTGDMFTAVNNNFILDHIGISCENGTMIQATNIDYTIDPSVDPFQGRNKRFTITQCNLVGGGNGLGSRLGFLEGYATCNFNANLITSWDIGFELSNCLSFEGLNNKSVLWNDQASTMITLRSNNFSGQTGGVGSYIPTGINAFNFNGNILRPRTSGYAASIDAASTTALGNIAGNIFITTGLTTGGIFNPSSVGFNELPTYNIQANTGIPDNTPTIQASIDRLQSYVTTINTINVLEKLNFGNSIKTTANLLVSSRLLVTNATGFLVDEIVTGGTSGFTGKVQSIDTVNNYIWIKYVVDGSGNAQYFTVGETITGGTSATATTYNGVDGTFKYYGAKEISVRFIATITLEKVGNGRDTFEIVPVKNGAALDDLSTVTYLEGARPRDGIAQAIIPFATDDILELHIRNLDATANCECQGLVFNISGR